MTDCLAYGKYSARINLTLRRSDFQTLTGRKFKNDDTWEEFAQEIEGKLYELIWDDMEEHIDDCYPSEKDKDSIFMEMKSSINCGAIKCLVEEFNKSEEAKSVKCFIELKESEDELEFSYADWTDIQKEVYNRSALAQEGMGTIELC